MTKTAKITDFGSFQRQMIRTDEAGKRYRLNYLGNRVYINPADEPVPEEAQNGMGLR